MRGCFDFLGAGCRLAPAVAAATLLAALPAAPARADHYVITDCEGLQAELATADEDKVITLVDTHLCRRSYTLAANAPTTLRGTGDEGFDGTGLTGPLLSGSDVEATRLTNLVFRDGDSGGNGGAISLTGDVSVNIVRCRFFGNSAAGDGGAIYVDANSGEGPVRIERSAFGGPGRERPGNRADGSGGAVYVEATQGLVLLDNTFVRNRAGAPGVVGGDGGAVYAVGLGGTIRWADNAFVRNKANDSGGGAALRLRSGSATLTANVFRANELTSAYDHYGGGLVIAGRSGGGFDDASLGRAAAAARSPVQVRQVGNLFRANSARSSEVTGTMPSGGGEWIEGVSVTSRGDRFIANHGAARARGAGLGFMAGADGDAFLGYNLVAAGNEADSSSYGAGVFAGVPDGCADCRALMKLWNPTIVSNSAGVGSTGAGVGSRGSGRLVVRNGIVFDNVVLEEGEPPARSDVGGFARTSILYSDVCRSGAPEPVAGRGNICRDPRSRDPATGDVHVRPGSPTIDRGSNDWVPRSLRADLDGQPRRMDGDRNGTLRVDMGADEYRPDRKVSLRLRGELTARGRVVTFDGVGRCRKDVRVRVQRRGGGGWKTVATDRTNDEGRYRTVLADRAGTYRALAPPSRVRLHGRRYRCAPGVSPERRR